MTTHTVHAAFIAYGTPRIERPDYECSTSGAIVLVHPYTSERKPIALCEANMPTYYALLEAGWLDDSEMSVIGNDTQSLAGLDKE